MRTSKGDARVRFLENKVWQLENEVYKLQYMNRQLSFENQFLKHKIDLQKQKRIALKTKTLKGVLVLVLLSCLCYLGWFGYDLLHLYTETHLPEEVVAETIDKVDEKEYLNLNWTNILERYPNCIGWLYVPNTDISYPIVQNTKDGNYYLTHSADNKPNRLGAIFIDETQPNDFTAENTIIYGHSVEFVGGMFTDISKFADKSFFDNNTEFYILTPTNTYRGSIRAFAETVDGSEWYVKESHGTLQEVLAKQKKSAKYFRETDLTDKTLVTLSTCKLPTNGGKKYVLQASLEYFMGGIEIESAK